MKRIILSLVAIAVIVQSQAQKTISDVNAEKRTVSSFHGIEVATGIKLILTKGATEDVAVSASKTEYRDRIVTEVRNGILKIHYETKSGAINKKEANKNLRAYVSYKTLDKLDVNTGARVEIDGVLTTPSLDLKSNTGGIVNGKIDIGNLKIDQNTGSKITLNGKAAKLEVDGDTGSKFFGEELMVADCSAKASTGARIYINVQKELDAKANTGGNIQYKGSTMIRNLKTNTGGSISRI